MIKRAHIRQFLAVVDAGSFTQAAARIRVTQPTLSAGIAELERQVGSRVFVRERRSVRLTDTGAKLLPLARDIERGFLAAAALGRSALDPWPTLRLGLLATIAPPVLEAMLAAIPAGLSIEMIDAGNAELRKALASGRVGALFTTLAADEGETVQCWPVMSEPYVMFVSARHRLAGVERIRPIELAGEIMIARRKCEVLSQTSRFFTQHGIRPRFALRSDNDAHCLSLVAAGAGITTAPLSYRNDAIVPLGMEGYDLVRTIGFIAPREETAGSGHRDRLGEIAGTLRARLAAAGLGSALS